MLKDLLNKGKCTLGLHSGDWRYTDSSSCAQVRVCDRCGTESRRVEHSFHDWDLLPEPACTLARTCGRCGEIESKMKHDWGDWQYDHRHRCSQRRVCVRCRVANDRTRTVHEWADYQFSDYYAGAVRVCARCGTLEGPGSSGADPSNRELSLIFQHLLATDSLADLRRLFLANHQALMSIAANDFVHRVREQAVDMPRSRERVDQIESLLDQCRAVGIDAAFNQASAPVHLSDALLTDRPRQPVVDGSPSGPAAMGAVPEIDRNLVGTWKNSRREGGDIAILRTEYYKLQEDGTAIRSEFMSYASTYAGGRVGNTGNRETGRGVWSARDGVLRLSDDRGSEVICRYRVEGNRLFCTFNNCFVQQWERSR